MSTVNVAAGVLIDAQGRFLLATRPEGKAYAGWWEFPGGKIEAGETPYQAAVRELSEELGIVVEAATPWLTETFVYPHTTVRLQFFRVTRWQGEPHPHEGQTFAWHPLGALAIDHILPANLPILAALALPERYAITCAEELGEAEQLAALERALAQGLRLVQVREKHWEPARRAAFAEAVAARCRAAGARLVIHGDAGLADRLQAGLHLTGAQLATLSERPAGFCGASCHTVEELRRAEHWRLDYALLSPVQPTLTHPQAAILGWDGLAGILAHGFAVPVYALGGLQPDDLPRAQAAGAHGVALMRGAWC